MKRPNVLAGNYKENAENLTISRIVTAVTKFRMDNGRVRYPAVKCMTAGRETWRNRGGRKKFNGN